MTRKMTAWLCVLLVLLPAGTIAWAGGSKESGEAKVEGAASRWKGTLRMWSNSYTPYIDRGGALRKVLGEPADEYMKMYPEVKIEFVERPGDDDYLAWLVTQIAGGVCPEIVFGHGSELEQYAPEGWFVDWYPILQKPNPYIKKGMMAATDPEHKAILKLYPEWSQYWQKGFTIKPQPGVFERAPDGNRRRVDRQAQVRSEQVVA